jgi:hypothetical protein
LPPAQPADQEARLGRPIPKSSIASLSPVSLPPTIQHSAFHAENVGPVNFSDRLRIADVSPSIHFVADDFSRSAMTKPSDRQPDFKPGQVVLFVAAAIVLLVYVWTHVR